MSKTHPAGECEIPQELRSGMKARAMRKLQNNFSRSTTISNFSTKTLRNYKIAWKIILQSLKLQMRLKYIKQGGKQLCNKKEIITLFQCIVDILDVEYNIQQSERARSCIDNRSNFF
jgi:hypothetical protein